MHSDFEIWRIKDLKGETLKQKIPCQWMIERFSPFWCTQYLMIWPPGTKFRTAKQQILDQLAQAGIPWIATAAGTELR
jgi:hypothetical protein